MHLIWVAEPGSQTPDVSPILSPRQPTTVGHRGLPQNPPLKLSRRTAGNHKNVDRDLPLHHDRDVGDIGNEQQLRHQRCAALSHPYAPIVVQQRARQQPTPRTALVEPQRILHSRIRIPTSTSWQAMSTRALGREEREQKNRAHIAVSAYQRARRHLKRRGLSSRRKKQGICAKTTGTAVEPSKQNMETAQEAVSQ